MDLKIWAEMAKDNLKYVPVNSYDRFLKEYGLRNGGGSSNEPFEIGNNDRKIRINIIFFGNGEVLVKIYGKARKKINYAR